MARGERFPGARLMGTGLTLVGIGIILFSVTLLFPGLLPLFGRGLSAASFLSIMLSLTAGLGMIITGLGVLVIGQSLRR